MRSNLIDTQAQLFHADNLIDTQVQLHRASNFIRQLVIPTTTPFLLPVTYTRVINVTTEEVEENTNLFQDYHHFLDTTEYLPVDPSEHL